MSLTQVRSSLSRLLKSMCGIFMVLLIVLLYAGAACAELVSLAEGLRLAAENSRFVRMAAQDENIAAADIVTARAKLLPSINASFSHTDLSDQPAAIFGALSVPMSQRDFVSYSLNIQQTLYDFRANASRYEAGKIGLEIKKMDSRRVRNFVAVDFALAYLDLLESEKILKVAENEVRRLEAHLKDAGSLYDEGVITKNDLLQAEVRLSDARQRLLSAGTSREFNASRLNSALVRPLKSNISVADMDGPAPLISEIAVEQAWLLAEQQRPELQIADAALRSLDLEKTAKKADYYPRLYARGGYDYTENRYQVHAGNWSLTLGLGINLFNGGTTGAELAKIDFSKAKLLEQRNRLADEIRLEVEKYMLNAKTAREKIAVSAGAVQQAEENLRINKARYEEGAGTATEVLDAVSLLTAAETNYYRARYEAEKAEAAVVYAIGSDLLEVYR